MRKTLKRACFPPLWYLLTLPLPCLFEGRCLQPFPPFSVICPRELESLSLPGRSCLPSSFLFFLTSTLSLPRDTPVLTYPDSDPSRSFRRRNWLAPQDRRVYAKFSSQSPDFMKPLPSLLCPPLPSDPSRTLPFVLPKSLLNPLDQFLDRTT